MSIGVSDACLGIDVFALKALDGVVNSFLRLGKEDTIVAIDGEDTIVSKVESWIQSAGYEPTCFKFCF